MKYCLNFTHDQFTTESSGLKLFRSFLVCLQNKVLHSIKKFTFMTKKNSVTKLVTMVVVEQPLTFPVSANKQGALSLDAM